MEMAVQGSRESFCNPLLFFLLPRRQSERVSWGRLVDDFKRGWETSPWLHLTFSILSSQPFPDILPPSPAIPAAVFPFSKTDRTRDACESKDERPGRDGYVGLCMWGEWMTPLILHAHFQSILSKHNDKEQIKEMHSTPQKHICFAFVLMLTSVFCRKESR